MAIEKLVCCECDRDFIFDEREQAFFKEKGFDKPKRCLECRRAKKKRNQEKEGLHPGGGSG